MRGTRQGLILLGLMLFLGACSTPKHTNTMIFGTTTKGGIDIGVDATSTTPTLMIGYKRHEAVWLPLVANKDNEGNAAVYEGIMDSEGNCKPLSPSHLAARVAPNCVNGLILAGNAGDDKDTYSAFASFGADFDADAGETKAKGGIAQYFATGLAARNLTERGGAALVNTNASPPEAFVQAKSEAEKIIALMDPDNDGKPNKDLVVKGLTGAGFQDDFASKRAEHYEKEGNSALEADLTSIYATRLSAILNALEQ